MRHALAALCLEYDLADVTQKQISTHSRARESKQVSTTEVTSKQRERLEDMWCFFHQ